MSNTDTQIIDFDFDKLLARNGIDPSANLETIRLALRGKIAELDEQIKALEEERRPKRGAPKRVISDDVGRTLRLIDLAQSLHELGFKPQPIVSLIRFAYQAEAILEKNGPLETRLFPHRGELGSGLIARTIRLRQVRSRTGRFLGVGRTSWRPYANP